eukprot:scaffold46362_cov68-Phaeocystis_antarctica.AAC.5
MRTTSVRPCATAAESAVSPAPSAAAASARAAATPPPPPPYAPPPCTLAYSSSSVTSCAAPWCAATCSGVCPVAVVALTAAPPPSSARAASSAPACTATWSGVAPSAPVASTAQPPLSSRSATAGAWPPPALRWSAVSPPARGAVCVERTRGLQPARVGGDKRRKARGDVRRAAAQLTRGAVPQQRPNDVTVTTLGGKVERRRALNDRGIHVGTEAQQQLCRCAGVSSDAPRAWTPPDDARRCSASRSPAAAAAKTCSADGASWGDSPTREAGGPVNARASAQTTATAANCISARSVVQCNFARAVLVNIMNRQ